MSSDKYGQMQWDQLSPPWSPPAQIELASGQRNAYRDEMSPSPTFQPPKYAIRVAPDKSLQWEPPADSEELALALSYHFPLPQTLEAKMRAATEKWLRARAARRSHGIDTAMVHQSVKAKRMAEKNIYGQIQVLCDQERQKPRLRHPKGNISSIRSGNPRDESASSTMGASESSKCRARDRGTGVPLQNSPVLDPRPDMSLMISWQVDTGEVTQRTAKKRPYSPDERLRVARNRGNACADHRRRRQRCDPKSCPQNKQWHKITAPPHAIPLAQDQLQPDNSSSFHTFQSPSGPKQECLNMVQATDTPSWESCSKAMSPSSLLGLEGACHIDVLSQNIPEAPDATASQSSFFTNWPAVSQSSISSSTPPPSIFTSTNTSGSDVARCHSVSDVSIASAPLRERHDLFKSADRNEIGPQQAQERSSQSSPANTALRHVNHASNTMDCFVEAEDLHLSQTDPLKNPEIPAKASAGLDYEYFIDSDYFPDLGRNSSNAFNLGISDNNGNLPTSINPRRLSKTPLTETTISTQGYVTTSVLSPPKGPSGKQRGFDEDQAATFSTANPSSIAATTTSTNSSTNSITRHPAASSSTNGCGNNHIMRDCYAPVRSRSLRQSSAGRSRLTSNRGANPTGTGTGTGTDPTAHTSPNSSSINGSILRRASTNSTTSQDSRYSTLLLLHEPSTRSRDHHLSGDATDIARRDSTNSCTSEESRTTGSNVRCGSLSFSDRDEVLGQAIERERERESDEEGPLGLGLARIGRRKGLGCGYKGRLLGVRDSAFGKGLKDRGEQHVENLSLGMHLVHI